MVNTAASMFGFFSIRIAIDSVFGMALVTPTGTTAPFSAMSGVWKNVMSLLCAGAAPPSALSVSSIVFVSNAALFHASAANASPGRSHPAAATNVSSVTPPPVFKTSLRCVFIVSPPFRTVLNITAILRVLAEFAAIWVCPVLGLLPHYDPPPSPVGLRASRADAPFEPGLRPLRSCLPRAAQDPLDQRAGFAILDLRL